MGVTYNGADPREVVWAKRQMAQQRAERRQSGQTTACRVCGREWFHFDIVDGQCGPKAVAYGGSCESHLAAVKYRASVVGKVLGWLRKIAPVLFLLTLAAPLAAQQSSPSAFQTRHGEVTQFTYRLVIPAGKCVELTGEQWLHPGGARLPWLIDGRALVTTAQIKALGKPVGLTLFTNGLAIAGDGDGLVTFRDGLLVSADLLTVKVYNPTPQAQWAYIVLQVEK